jgi:aminoglycoside phosphotransferase (APT) family kinase protein
MQQIELQILRSALNELGGDISTHATHPLAQGKIQITNFLLAHLLGRQGAAQSYQGIDEEVLALQQAEQDEQQILSARPATAETEPALTAEALTPYLRTKLNNPKVTVTDLQALLGGFSKQTYILTLSGADQLDNKLVMRRDLAGGPVDSQAADELPIIQSMHAVGVAVAEPLWADRNPPFSGTCIVTRAVAGKTAYDSTGVQVGAEGKDAAMALARVLGKIHHTPISALNLPPELANATLGEHVRRMVKFYEKQWQQRRVSVSPTLVAAFTWLYANVPENSPPSLVHGDASLRNLLIHDGKESAMLDWELWHVGDHNEDLAYCRTDVEQFMTWDAFMSEYRTHGGYAFDKDAGTYYAIFGALRNAVFAESCLHSFVNASVPEPKLAYGALAMGRKLICVIADQLKKCSNDSITRGQE